MKLDKIVDAFGKENDIFMDFESPQVKYYTFLMKVFSGAEWKFYPTNKCPFYQKMFWGTLLLLFLSLPLLVGFLVTKLIDVLPFPAHMKNNIERNNKRTGPFGTYFGNFLGLLCFSVLGLLFFGNISWIGWILYWGFAIIPYAILYWTSYGILAGVTWVATFLWELLVTYHIAILALLITGILYLSYFIVGLFSLFVLFWIILKISSVIINSSLWKYVIKFIEFNTVRKLEKEKVRTEKRKIQLEKEKAKRILKDKEPVPEYKEPLIDRIHHVTFEFIDPKMQSIGRFLDKVWKIVITPFVYTWIFIVSIFKMLASITGNHCPPILILTKHKFIVQKRYINFSTRRNLLEMRTHNYIVEFPTDNNNILGLSIKRNDSTDYGNYINDNMNHSTKDLLLLNNNIEILDKMVDDGYYIVEIQTPQFMKHDYYDIHVNNVCGVYNTNIVKKLTKTEIKKYNIINQN